MSLSANSCLFLEITDVDIIISIKMLLNLAPTKEISPVFNKVCSLWQTCLCPESAETHTAGQLLSFSHIFQMVLRTRLWQREIPLHRLSKFVSFRFILIWCGLSQRIVWGVNDEKQHLSFASPFPLFVLFPTNLSEASKTFPGLLLLLLYLESWCSFLNLNFRHFQVSRLQKCSNISSFHQE